LTPEPSQTTPLINPDKFAPGALTGEESSNPSSTAPKESPPTAEQLNPGQYCWGVGRRKSAVARVRIRPGNGKIMVNERDMEKYFTSIRDRRSVRSPLTACDCVDKYDVFIKTNGGGTTGQSEAVKLGIARALVAANPASFEILRDGGYLTRDSRMVERKKYGRKKARKRFQFSKR